MAAPAQKTIVITGSQGKVGRHVVAKARAAGYKTVGIDLVRGIYDAPAPGDEWPDVYIQGDLAGDPGVAFSTISRFGPVDAVIHVAAVPDPTHSPPHVVFQNNVMSTFHVVEAVVRLGVPRLVNISSECVPGFFHPERIVRTVPGASPDYGSGYPKYCPVDEDHPWAPQDGYAISKGFGEQLCSAAIRRAPSPLSIVSIRPSWCQDSRNIARNLGPLVRDPTVIQEGMWAYICISDLAEAILAAATVGGITGHEVCYIAADDNAGGRDLAAAVKQLFPYTEVRALARTDASGLDCSKAKRLLGWAPKLTWRDFLAADGTLLPDVASGKVVPGYVK